MAAAQQAAFRERQRNITWQFRTYRNTGRNPTAHEVALDKARHLLIPKRGWFRGVRSRPGRPKLDRILRRAPFSWGPEYSEEAAKAARLGLQRDLRRYGLRLHRTLGWGGNGIATLFYRDPDDGGPRDYFVAKCNLNPAGVAHLDGERAMTDVRFLVSLGSSCRGPWRRANWVCWIEIPRCSACRSAQKISKSAGREYRLRRRK